MAKVKVIYDRKNCIGAGSCQVIAPEFWEMAADGKADLKGGKKISDGKYELEIEVTKKELEKLKESAQACPVFVIEVIEEQ